MVRVIGRSAEEREGIKRGSRLAVIAREVFPECSITGEGGSSVYISVFSPGKKGIHVYYLENCIRIDDKSIFDDALKLAEAYEDSGEPEFTVKKDYDE